MRRAKPVIEPRPTEPMIEVPLAAFALLMAYCHTRSPDVPKHVRSHPDYPGQYAMDGHQGHLRRALRPYIEDAMARLEPSVTRIYI